MKLILSIFIIFIPLNYNIVYSEVLINKNDYERLSKDLINLQKFVYKNLLPKNNKIENSKDSKVVLPTSDKISDIENTLKNINSRLEQLEIKIIDMEENIKSLYSLYLEKNKKKSISNNSDAIILEQDSSSIVIQKNDNKTLGQLKLSEIPEEDISDELTSPEVLDNDFNQDDIETDLNPATIIPENTIIDVNNELLLAKNYIAGLDNNNALLALTRVVESNSDNKNVVAEAHYLLGRTYFIDGLYIDSVKHFGIRHQNYSSVQDLKADNYLWLAKSLFQIGDKENACLALEDIIFSNEFNDQSAIIEDSKFLQEEKNCGLIID